MSTYFHPRTAPPLSPVRPATSHSMRSTVRTVPPSPDSLKEVLKRSLTGQGTRPIESKQPLRTDSSGSFAAKSDQQIFPKYIHHAENNDFPTASTPPSLQHSDARLHCSSPQKSRSQSPHKQPSSTPSNLPSHRESPSPDDHKHVESECPDTPSPMTREQQKFAYAPLQVSTTALDEQPPTGPLRKTRSKPLLLLPTRTQTDTHHRAALPRKPIPNNEPARHVSVSGQSNISNVSAVSRRTVFLTPGRDELERKKALVEVDDGPFARAVSMQDLEARRMMVAEGKEAKRKERNWGCGSGCSVM